MQDVLNKPFVGQLSAEIKVHPSGEKSVCVLEVVCIHDNYIERKILSIEIF